MKDSTTITISSGHNISEDQTYIKSITEDNRWWKRLLYFLIGKDQPTITTYYSILSLDSDTQITIKKI